MIPFSAHMQHMHHSRIDPRLSPAVCLRTYDPVESLIIKDEGTTVDLTLRYKVQIMMMISPSLQQNAYSETQFLTMKNETSRPSLKDEPHLCEHLRYAPPRNESFSGRLLPGIPTP
jgi:hypothetical protein